MGIGPSKPLTPETAANGEETTQSILAHIDIGAITQARLAHLDIEARTQPQLAHLNVNVPTLDTANLLNDAHSPLLQHLLPTQAPRRNWLDDPQFQHQLFTPLDIQRPRDEAHISTLEVPLLKVMTGQLSSTAQAIAFHNSQQEVDTARLDTYIAHAIAILHALACPSTESSDSDLMAAQKHPLFIPCIEMLTLIVLQYDPTSRYSDLPMELTGVVVEQQQAPLMQLFSIFTSMFAHNEQLELPLVSVPFQP